MPALQVKDADGLTKHQRDAFVAIENWMKSPSLEFTLKGHAGTGKTFVASTFLKTNGTKINYCITAPTHKALHVIENKIGKKGKTLQSLHGLRMNVDLSTFDISNPQFDPLGIPHIQNYRLIIIDEASMINSGLFELNREAAKTYNTKILYIGDPLQLPPVKEEVGKVFTDVVDSFELVEIVRQEKDNDLVNLFEMLRNDILTGDSNTVRYLGRNRDKEISNDFKVLSNTKFKEEILKYYSSSKFENDIDYIRLSSFTRESVKRWNSYIRSSIIPHSEEAVLNIHDLLTSYTNIVDDYKNPIIINSDDYIITDIDKYVNNQGIETFSLNLQSVIDRRQSPKLLLLDHTNEDSLKRYIKILSYLHFNASIKRIPGGFKEYYNFKNSILCMIDVKLDEMNANKEVGRDIDYGYSLTTHKLQGSTIENVAVDLRNMIYPTNNVNYMLEASFRNRLLYVALSRATNKAILHF